MFKMVHLSQFNHHLCWKKLPFKNLYFFNHCNYNENWHFAQFHHTVWPIIVSYKANLKLKVICLTLVSHILQLFPIWMVGNTGDNWGRSVSDQGKVKTEGLGAFFVEGFGWCYLKEIMHITEACGVGRAASDTQNQTNSSISNRVKAQFPND